jgi:2-hydroxychromene-2-carboxylate isomerase
MAREIDFFFFYGSTYTYLTVMRIERLLAEHDVAVRWHPFNLPQIVREMNNIPFRTKPKKLSYMFRDIERRAKRYGLPFGDAPVYPLDAPLDPDNFASRVGLVAAEQGWCAEYTRETYRAWFLDKKPPGLANNVAEVVGALGKGMEDIAALAGTDRIRAKFETETDLAREFGVFGSPTFAVGSEIFWGDDRFEDALEWCVSNS